jgi:tetratricopeptide (TPR) repeat protein
MRKDFDKAITDFTNVIRLDPKNAVAFCDRGSVHFKRKDFDKAAGDYDEAIKLDPNNAVAIDRRGSVYAIENEYRKAIDEYYESIRVDPKYPSPYNNLAWLLATCPKDKLRDGKKALELATKACELSEWKWTFNLGTLGAAYAECGDFKEAVKWQKKAIELGYEDVVELEKAQKRLKLYEEGKPYRSD